MFVLEYTQGENPNNNDRDLEEERMKLLAQDRTPERIARILEIEDILGIPNSSYTNQD